MEGQRNVPVLVWLVKKWKAEEKAREKEKIENYTDEKPVLESDRCQGKSSRKQLKRIQDEDDKTRERGGWMDGRLWRIDEMGSSFALRLHCQH